MKEIRTQIEVEASAEKVWDILTDFDKYPDWNPFVKKASGCVRKGEKIEIFIAPPGGKNIVFKPTVKNAVENRELRWCGHLLLPVFFNGEHIFEINKYSSRSITLVQREIFTGLLVSLLWGKIAESTKKGFLAMNEALKRRAESNE